MNFNWRTYLHNSTSFPLIFIFIILFVQLLFHFLSKRFIYLTSWGTVSCGQYILWVFLFLHHVIFRSKAAWCKLLTNHTSNSMWGIFFPFIIAWHKWLSIWNSKVEACWYLSSFSLMIDFASTTFLSNWRETKLFAIQNFLSNNCIDFLNFYSFSKIIFNFIFYIFEIFCFRRFIVIFVLILSLWNLLLSYLWFIFYFVVFKVKLPTQCFQKWLGYFTNMRLYWLIFLYFCWAFYLRFCQSWNIFWPFSVLQFFVIEKIEII